MSTRDGQIGSLRSERSNWFFARNISENPSIQAIVDDAQSRYVRFDDAYRGLQWLLARTGHELGVAKHHDGREYRLHKQAGMDTSPIIPEITVLYEVLENDIDIIAIRVSEPSGASDL